MAGDLKVSYEYINNEDGAVRAFEGKLPSVMKGTTPWLRCGVDFNPSGSGDVRDIKAVCAGLMGLFEALPAVHNLGANGKRAMATAMTHLEAAQMFAVKGLFVDEHAGEFVDEPTGSGPGVPVSSDRAST